ncbi:hypothetical protein BDR05DRAFT_1006815 [Suillus weaverae]|nr:hypothetical protein BDR05DRAFT_1006815 [Suillus weaverae]
MSYWYGKVAKIYLRPRGETHDVWLDIQWYYRRVDLEDAEVDLAESIGEYELVLSDHNSLVDMMCIEVMSDHATIINYDEGDLAQHRIPPETLYHRWNITIKFVRGRKDMRIDGVHLNVRVFRVVSIPVKFKFIHRTHSEHRSVAATNAVLCYTVPTLPRHTAGIANNGSITDV